jgi:methylated-DNA-[protein]-cysteine S-methyltransferase
MTQFALFETAIGACAVAWGPHGIVGFQLPEPRPDATRARFRKRFPDAEEAPLPAAFLPVVERIRGLMTGAKDDLADVALDMSEVPDFERQVYDIARKVPPGETITYGEIASRIGDKSLSREVGAALGRNPFPIVVPCHRVLAASGKTGGFSAPGGVETKMKMLAIEGARREEAPMLFDSLPMAAARKTRR